MIDAASFAMHNHSPSYLSPINRGTDALGFRHPENFSDKLLMLCSPVVKAYGLKTKAWGTPDRDIHDLRHSFLLLTLLA